MASHGLNRVILIGTLADAPKLKTTDTGKTRLALRVHTIEPYADRDGTARERHGWHTVVVWGRRGEALSVRLAEGHRVAIEGRLRGYETNGDPPRWRDEIVADDIVLLEPRAPQAA